MTDDVEPPQVMLSRGISLLCQWPPLVEGRRIVAAFVCRGPFLKPCPHRRGAQACQEQTGSKAYCHRSSPHWKCDDTPTSKR